jgi:hypothetical protein
MNQNYKQYQEELRAVLNEWDFLTAHQLGTNDEYDCLINPILAILQRNGTVDEIENLIRHERKEHFGLAEESPELRHTVYKIVSWWEKRQLTSSNMVRPVN